MIATAPKPPDELHAVLLFEKSRSILPNTSVIAWTPMNRRNFIRTSGISLLSLLTHKALGSSPLPKSGNTLGLPDGVTGRVKGQPVTMTKGGGSGWNYHDINVSMQEAGEALAVFLEAPSSTLSSITLHWRIPAVKPTSIMNDHWERTYGDVSWHRWSASEKLPWYFLEFDGRRTRGCGVKTGAKAFCAWQVSNEELLLTLDTQNGGEGVTLGERVLSVAEIVTISSAEGETPHSTAQRFMGMLCDHPRMPKDPVYGINDWYFTYGRNSKELILAHTGLIAPLADGLDNRPFSVIDAGWFRTSAAAPEDVAWSDDMGVPNSKFGDMHQVAEEIRRLGMRPGIWTRPLCGSSTDAPSRMLPVIHGREEKEPVLDPSIPENLERVRGLLRLYREWGYELVKFDFTSFDIFGKWGFEMTKEGLMTDPGWHLHDRSRTNAEIVLDLYHAVRDGAGDAYVISCNTFGHLAAGIFELNRIGDDTSGLEWDRTRRMGVNTLAFRGIHHGRFYAADPDCVGVTEKIAWERNSRWLELVARSGVPLFISADPKATGTTQKAAIKGSFALASRAQPLGEPLDWMERAVPENWRFDGETEHFSWD